MRYKFTIEYDGSAFYGWQRQPGVRTVEGELETALSELYQQPIDLAGQGRTDRGVHARAQTAHADLPDRFPPERILYALKGLLPRDIAIRDVELCADNFHARFDASARSYSYHITTQQTALCRNYLWFCYLDPDPEILKQTAEKVTGTHDFLNFCIPPDNEMQTTLSTVTESRWEVVNEGERLIYHITANRFLRHMVRRIVGSMVQAAAGKITMDQFDSLLAGTQTKQKGFAAPPEGLILEKVHYR